MTAKKTTPKKPQTKKEAPQAARKLKTGKYRSFRLQKRAIKPTRLKLPSSFRLLKTSLGVLKRNWKLFGGIILIYCVLNILFVRGLSGGGDLGNLKSTFDQIVTGNWGHLSTGITLFVYLLGSSGNTTSGTAGAYQSILLIIVSLVLIWVLRQVHAKHKVNIRDGYYKGLYPMIPFVLVLCVIALQLVPGIIGTQIYNLVTSSGIATLFVEKAVWGLLAFSLILLSIYMICSSVFALYIVTLPDMKPVQSLRAARQLVLYRRWSVVRKVIFLPIVLLVLSFVIMLPLILFATPVAPWAFFLLTMIGVAIIHSYMYALYRSLL
jgi:hypothetical protein